MARRSFGTWQPLGCARAWVGALPLQDGGLRTRTLLQGNRHQRLPWHLKRYLIWENHKGKGAVRPSAQQGLFLNFERERSSNLQGNKSGMKKQFSGKNPKPLVVNLWNSLVQYCGNCCLNTLLEGSDLVGVGNVAAAH